MKISVN